MEVETQGRRPDLDSLPGGHALDTPAKAKAFDQNGNHVVSYPGPDGRDIIYATYTSWQQVALDTFDHEEWHATTWATQGSEASSNERTPRAFAAQAVMNIQQQNGSLVSYINKLQQRHSH